MPVAQSSESQELNSDAPRAKARSGVVQGNCPSYPSTFIDSPQGGSSDSTHSGSTDAE